VDGDGYPAQWLEDKMKPYEEYLISSECIEFKRSEGDE
jgi:hypothetical protein